MIWDPTLGEISAVNLWLVITYMSYCDGRKQDSMLSGYLSQCWVECLNAGSNVESRLIVAL